MLAKPMIKDFSTMAAIHVKEEAGRYVANVGGNYYHGTSPEEALGHAVRALWVSHGNPLTIVLVTERPNTRPVHKLKRRNKQEEG